MHLFASILNIVKLQIATEDLNFPSDTITSFENAPWGKRVKEKESGSWINRSKWRKSEEKVKKKIKLMSICCTNTSLVSVPIGAQMGKKVLRHTMWLLARTGQIVLDCIAAQMTLFKRLLILNAAVKVKPL